MQKKEDSGEAIARNMMEMSSLRVPIICVIIGEGSSGGALALGVGDKILMLENAVYSILSPEGFASILYKDSNKNKEAAENMKITAKDLKEFKIIDEIIKEPGEGAHESEKEVAQNIKKSLLKNLKLTSKIEIDKLIFNRYQKFRNM